MQRTRAVRQFWQAGLPSSHLTWRILPICQLSEATANTDDEPASFASRPYARGPSPLALHLWRVARALSSDDSIVHSQSIWQKITRKLYAASGDELDSLFGVYLMDICLGEKLRRCFYSPSLICVSHFSALGHGRYRTGMVQTNIDSRKKCLILPRMGYIGFHRDSPPCTYWRVLVLGHGWMSCKYSGTL